LLPQPVLHDQLRIASLSHLNFIACSQEISWADSHLDPDLVSWLRQLVKIDFLLSQHLPLLHFAMPHPRAPSYTVDRAISEYAWQLLNA
jgi:hypothetical protein